MFKKVCIIGCGLIGSSILRAIKDKKLSKNVSACDKSKDVIAFIKKEIAVTKYGISTKAISVLYKVANGLAKSSHVNIASHERRVGIDEREVTLPARPITTTTTAIWINFRLLSVFNANAPSKAIIAPKNAGIRTVTVSWDR